ncbi:MAG TPA: zf-HC2 domain-containing protein [Candidatus Binatia bacterium]|nr:zf-HC2 domain-containing protein [Candidatus Binatia bacterium]
MTCRHCRRLLSPHLDNVLMADERSGVLAHLAQCSACAERLHQLESNRQLLHALPTTEVTRGMDLLLQSKLQNLESKVKKQKETKSWRIAANSLFSQIQRSKPQSWWRGWGMVSVGTLATCVASLLFFLFSNIHTPPPVSAEEVVSSMDGLISVLDSDDDLSVIYRETEEEALPDWREDLDQWPAGDARDLRG